MSISLSLFSNSFFKMSLILYLFLSRFSLTCVKKIIFIIGISTIFKIRSWMFEVERSLVWLLTPGRTWQANGPAASRFEKQKFMR
ncbi:MAG: hypothetical protein CSA23_07010 [Deltaproteobacteria bacterium]|nr:MAG: hypothetical protein CSA23_07010 [Deltaproteobacteria bacterium]